MNLIDYLAMLAWSPLPWILLAAWRTVRMFNLLESWV